MGLFQRSFMFSQRFSNWQCGWLVSEKLLSIDMDGHFSQQHPTCVFNPRNWEKKSWRWDRKKSRPSSTQNVCLQARQSQRYLRCETYPISQNSKQIWAELPAATASTQIIWSPDSWQMKEAHDYVPYVPFLTMYIFVPFFWAAPRLIWTRAKKRWVSNLVSVSFHWVYLGGACEAKINKLYVPFLSLPTPFTLWEGRSEKEWKS